MSGMAADAQTLVEHARTEAQVADVVLSASSIVIVVVVIVIVVVVVVVVVIVVVGRDSGTRSPTTSRWPSRRSLRYDSIRLF